MNLRGQGESFVGALRAARSLRLHHGVIIEGGRGSGKTTAAMLIAQALLCEGEETSEACGDCGACKKVMMTNHPDLHMVTVPEDKVEIPVDDIRGLSSKLEKWAVEGRARVVIIDPADGLNPSGQNAILKTLEEPGVNTFLLLTSNRQGFLLPTVRSRASRLEILPLPSQVIIEELERKKIGDDATRGWASTFCGGALGVAADLIEADLCPIHQQIVDFIHKDHQISAVSLSRSALAGAGSTHETLRRSRLLLGLLRATMRVELESCLAPTDAGAYFAAGFERWTGMVEAIFEAETDLDLRIAPEQVLTVALLRWQEMLAARPST